MDQQQVKRDPHSAVAPVLMQWRCQIMKRCCEDVGLGVGWEMEAMVEGKGMRLGELIREVCI